MTRRVYGWLAQAGVFWLALAMVLLTACGGAATTATTAATATTASKPTTGATATAGTAGGAASSPAASPRATAPGSPVASPAGGGAAGGPVRQLKIGVVLSLTGDSQIYGNPQKNAIQLAFDEINAGNLVPGFQLAPVIEDDAGKKDQGVTAFDKLIKSDNVIAIIGPTLSNTALATDPAAQQAGVPVLAVSNTAGGIVEIGDFIFRDSLSEAQVIPVTVKTAKDKLGLKKVAVMYANDNAFTKSGYDVFTKALADNGIQVTTTQTYATTDTDFSAQLTEIKGTNPDAIVLSALAESAQIVKQARDLGIAVTIVGGNGLNSPALIKNAGPAAEGVIVGAAWNSANDTPENQKFIQAYKAKYNADPDQFAAQAYSGVYILANAIKNAGPNPDRKAVRDALAKTKGLPTPLGAFGFKENRDADHAPVIQIVKNGKFDVFK